MIKPLSEVEKYSDFLTIQDCLEILGIKVAKNMPGDLLSKFKNVGRRKYIAKVRFINWFKEYMEIV